MNPEQIEGILNKQKAFFDTGLTKDVAFRKRALERLRDAIERDQDVIAVALKADLNKSSMEAYMTETGMVLSDLKYILRHLDCWTKRHYVLSPLAQAPAVSYTVDEPYGQVLVMAPWNYPFQLSMEPLVGALAAGNTVVLKPSNYAPHTATVMKNLLAGLFPEEYVAVIEGGREENTYLLDSRFDYIFFTGGPAVGRLVLEKAAKNLTPVSLELGGKSPCIVTESADLAVAAKRVAFGKWLNSGQTCVAPDYLLIDEKVEEPFLELLRIAANQFYTDEAIKNPDYPKMINQKHFERVSNLMKGEEIYSGGRTDPESQKIEPTILRHVSKDAPIMQEEIFGPVLPVMTYKKIDEAIEYVKDHEKPLALYLFCEDRKIQNKILNEISFGGGCINDTIVHLATSRMPFGGVGNSGMGGYHGKYSFETFSHKKSIIKRATWLDIPLRYAPYTPEKLKLLKWFL